MSEINKCIYCKAIEDNLQINEWDALTDHNEFSHITEVFCINCQTYFYIQDNILLDENHNPIDETLATI